MTDLDAILSAHLARGRISFTREELLRALSASSSTLTHSLSKLARKGRIANPRPGFYLILAPEDKANGAPDPARWIDRLMQHQNMDYRVSLLAAAKLHGASTEPQAFQLIVPRQLRDFAIGRYRLEFLTQPPNAFTRTNRAEWLHELKTETATAKAAGIELTLLDCAHWFHKAGGISQVAQIARDLGAKAKVPKLTTLARAFENAAVMRLGYLLELAGHEQQASALGQFAQQAKSVQLLDPSSRLEPGEMSGRWKIAVNRPVGRGS
ncbi:MAG: type IV toxin-antitoxin system AbiEi family antitoxin domain-containing protein [Burkholderiales bacterium]